MNSRMHYMWVAVIHITGIALSNPIKIREDLSIVPTSKGGVPALRGLKNAEKVVFRVFGFFLIQFWVTEKEVFQTESSLEYFQFVLTLKKKKKKVAQFQKGGNATLLLQLQEAHTKHTLVQAMPWKVPFICMSWL